LEEGNADSQANCAVTAKDISQQCLSHAFNPQSPILEAFSQRPAPPCRQTGLIFKSTTIDETPKSQIDLAPIKGE
jgi:hypothetical protein